MLFSLTWGLQRCGARNLPINEWIPDRWVGWELEAHAPCQDGFWNADLILTAPTCILQLAVNFNSSVGGQPDLDLDALGTHKYHQHNSGLPDAKQHRKPESSTYSPSHCVTRVNRIVLVAKATLVYWRTSSIWCAQVSHLRRTAHTEQPRTSRLKGRSLLRSTRGDDNFISETLDPSPTPTDEHTLACLVDSWTAIETIIARDWKTVCGFGNFICHNDGR